MRHAQFRNTLNDDGKDEDDESRSTLNTIFDGGKLDKNTNELLSKLQSHNVSMATIVHLKQYFIDQGYIKYNLIRSDIMESTYSLIEDFCINELHHSLSFDILYYTLLGQENKTKLTDDIVNTVMYVNNPSKYIVYGYIRIYIIEANDMRDLLIPPLVMSLCIAWFTYNTETFSKYDSDHMMISDNAETIETNGKTKNIITTAYGTHSFNKIKTIYSWTIRILEKKDKSTIYFGIDSSNKKYIKMDYSSPEINHYDFYALSSDGILYSKYKREGKVEIIGNGKGFESEDVITIEINTEKNKIRYIMNMEDIFVSNRIDLRDNICANTDKYHMAIAINGKCKVQIIASS